MKTIHITCDVCGKSKGEANHWIAYVPIAPGIIEFRPGDLARDSCGDLCSEQCAIRKLSEVLAQIQQRTTEK